MQDDSREAIAVIAFNAMRASNGLPDVETIKGAPAREFYLIAADAILALQVRLQPIDSAPKDGTWVLLFGGMADGGYLPGGATEAEIRHPVVAFWHDIQQAWVFSKNDGWWAVYDLPTHWVSLDTMSSLSTEVPGQ